MTCFNKNFGPKCTCWNSNWCE